MNPEETSNLDILDEIDFSIRDLRKMLFLSECYDLYRRDLIPNLEHNSCYYTEDLLDELQSDLIDHMNQQALEIDFLTEMLSRRVLAVEHDSGDDGEGVARAKERATSSVVPNTNEGLRSDEGATS